MMMDCYNEEIDGLTRKSIERICGNVMSKENMKMKALGRDELIFLKRTQLIIQVTSRSSLFVTNRDRHLRSEYIKLALQIHFGLYDMDNNGLNMEFERLQRTNQISEANVLPLNPRELINIVDAQGNSSKMSSSIVSSEDSSRNNVDKWIAKCLIDDEPIFNVPSQSPERTLSQLLKARVKDMPHIQFEKWMSDVDEMDLHYADLETCGFSFAGTFGDLPVRCVFYNSTDHKAHSIYRNTRRLNNCPTISKLVLVRNVAINDPDTGYMIRKHLLGFSRAQYFLPTFLKNITNFGIMRCFRAILKQLFETLEEIHCNGLSK